MNPQKNSKPIMASLKELTLSSVKWTAVEKMGLLCIQFIMGVVMARLLSPDDYGVIGMISILFAISSTFIDGGFGSAIIRKQDCTQADCCTVFYFNIVVALLFYVTLFFTAPWIAIFFKQPLLCAIVRVQSINFLLNSLMLVQDARLRKELKFKVLAKRSVLATLLSGIVGIIFAYLGYGVWALIYQGLVASVINLVYIWSNSKWRPSLLFSWDSFKSLGDYGSKLLAAGLLHTVYSNLTTLVIGRVYSARDLGFYNRGSSLASLPVDTTNSILLKISFPILSKIQDDDKRLIEVYRKFIRMSSIPIFFGSMLLISMGKPLVLLLLTEKWLPAVDFLSIFTFSIVFNHVSNLNLNLLQVKGRTDLYLKLEIIKKTISFIILFGAIPFGAIGICLSKVIYCQISLLANLYYTRKLFKYGYWSLVKDFIFYLLAAVFSCLPMYFINNIYNLNCFAGIFLSIVVGLALYSFLLRRDECFMQLIQFVSKKISLKKA